MEGEGRRKEKPSWNRRTGEEKEKLLWAKGQENVAQRAA